MSLIPYTVASCSSEDEQHPARELQSFHSQSRGWQSSRFCDFPQEIVLKFGGPVNVQQVQLLSHQFKIATRIELFVGSLAEGQAEPPASGFEGIQFSRLGHFSLDCNERSKFQARELKTVYVPRRADGLYLRLLLHKCHVNEHNLYSQLGLLAVRVIGDGGGDGERPLDAPLSRLATRPPLAPEEAEERAGGAVDGGVMALLHELHRDKEEAVRAEEYEHAKALKTRIEELRGVGVELSSLERKKLAAVQREDYD
ncbi:hypothetical protein EMIHUDRAFT_417671, partial [Emiliania huxleyi CCMP1516]|uniref:UVR domain-containing protein n=3 Tax=Emiliania huxleyi TaxID=2903 RepID=A0A0D3KP33_EMIH1